MKAAFGIFGVPTGKSGVSWSTKLLLKRVRNSGGQRVSKFIGVNSSG